MIEILCENGRFHLRNGQMSYVMQLVSGKYLMHAYFGAPLREPRGRVSARFVRDEASFGRNELGLDTLPQECPTFGYGDLREGALEAELADGSRVLALEYAAHRVVDGKPALKGLPASYGENAKTLEITLRDALSGVEAVLCYTVFDDVCGVTRSVRVTNGGEQPLTLHRVMSACVDFPATDYRLLTLSGAWARERHWDERPIAQGETAVSSARGASSHQSAPFMALLAPGAGEESGEVYGLSLVYSGSFRASATVDHNGQTRAMIGINPFDFSWRLETGESFQSPEAVLVYSSAGLRGMSRAFHRFCLGHIVRGRFAKAQRPVLINNWEATYFGFDEQKLLSIAAEAAKLGVELFVLDDGWFGHRDSDNCSLGDWVEDRRKLPEGLCGLSRKIHALGLQFGIWMEPEMVSPDSDLYRAHPDWCLHVPGRQRLEGRHQLVLDMGREDVQQYVIAAVSRVLESAEINYIKWDMNRNMTPIGSAVLPSERQRETAHRYMLGLYRVLETLTQRFPNVLMESCAGGGGRFDLGMLHYMPQTWCSDDTDAEERCYIQYSTSLLFPPCTMGAHVSAVPNHQLERVTPLHTRSAVAMGGTYGFELDVTRLTDAEKQEMAREIAYYKQRRDTLMYGDFYRLKSPYTGNLCAWMAVSQDGSEAVVTCVRQRSENYRAGTALRLCALQPETLYLVVETGETLYGDELMQMGLDISLPVGDDTAMVRTLRAVPTKG